jgi:hypothetical protein
VRVWSVALNPRSVERLRDKLVSQAPGADIFVIEQLAGVNRLHSKVVRQALRLAFLSPEVTPAMLEGRQPVGLTQARVPNCILCHRWSIVVCLADRSAPKRPNESGAPSPPPESAKPPLAHGERTKTGLFNFTSGDQADKATRALCRMALSKTIPQPPEILSRSAQCMDNTICRACSGVNHSSGAIY